VKPLALLDANALYSATLRDTLVQLAVSGAFQARWTNQIHDEWIRNVLKNRPDLDPQKLSETRRLMDFHLPDALVEGFEPLIETLSLPDPDDRHVLAAAIHAKAPTIVTWNLRDFPSSALAPHSIQAVSPDAFTLQLLEESQSEVLQALATQRERLQRPAQTATQFLETLSRQGLTRFVSALEPLRDQL